MRSSGATVRAFIAIDMPQEIKERIGVSLRGLQQASQFMGTRLMWVEPENLHLTLSFLGDINETQVRMAIVTLRGCAKMWQQFDLKVGNPALFPEGHVPRVIAHRLGKDIDALAVVQRMLTNGLRRRGFDLELREFSPHLTLARIKNRVDLSGLKRVVDETRGEKVGAFTVTELKLMKSTLTPEGAIYETIAVVKLPKHTEPKESSENSECE